MLRRAIILRPYSLEREFGRMRVCLNNYLAHEVASRLNSVGIASEPGRGTVVTLKFPKRKTA